MRAQSGSSSSASPQPRVRSQNAAVPDSAGVLFAGLFGLFLGVGLLKWGNPVILDRLVEIPKSIEEWRAFSWPIRIAYFALPLVAAAGLAVWLRTPDRKFRGPIWILASFSVWLTWQLLASMNSIDPATTRIVLIHLLCCGGCFLLGHFALGRIEQTRVFWLCVSFAFLGVLGFAFDQHFGGLEGTRKMIMERPDSVNLPPEYLARIRSNRVFSTLVYPNALAGAILLLLPLTTVLAHRFGERWGPVGSRATAGLVLIASLSVLVWSGSKAGWLIAMGIALLLLFLGPIPKRLKLGLAAAFVVVGLVGFAVTFAEKLSRGATSVAARVDYWSAAWQGFCEKPVLGQGPGAFKRVYARLKRPESEMAQLAHNDYLQQATDSGLVGFTAYSIFILGSLGWLYRYRTRFNDGLQIGVGIGLLAWFMHGFVEFGLYIPATSWCAFAFLGWLIAQKPSSAPA